MSKKIIQDIITRAVGSVCGDNGCEGDEGGAGRKAKKGVGRRFLVSVSLIMLGVVIVLAVFLLYSSSFSRVALKIQTNRRVIDLDDTVSLSQDGVNNSVKYDVMKFDDTESVKVATTGSGITQKNAAGTVTLYNSGKTSQKLIVGTRLETTDGKIYKIDKSVTIPAAGSVAVTIHSALPGPLYNIPPSNFTVPGLKNGPKYNLIRASSSREISGGYSGQIRIASKADIEKARGVLKGLITEKLTQRALLQVPKDFVLYNDAMFFTFTDNVIGGAALSDVTDGQPGLKMTGTLGSMIINLKDLGSYLTSSKMSNQNKSSEVVYFGLDKLSFKIINKEKTVLDGKQVVTANITGQVSAVGDFDENLLKSKLIGIQKSKYQDVFKDFPTIEKAEATFNPSWALYFPSDVARITIDKGF
ncbi:MAG: baseplate J/gp47 family protein [Candidatus Vogelbacteria bacterium]|nr:baseplate J/gp47 family protein [Candidatus Vogelbacteria bacterium]